VFDSKKKIKVATADGVQQKLTSSQRQAVSFNECLLYMYTGQVRDKYTQLYFLLAFLLSMQLAALKVFFSGKLMINFP